MSRLNKGSAQNAFAASERVKDAMFGSGSLSPQPNTTTPQGTSPAIFDLQSQAARIDKIERDIVMIKQKLGIQ